MACRSAAVHCHTFIGPHQVERNMFYVIHICIFSTFLNVHNINSSEGQTRNNYAHFETWQW